jgi:hypothetical protein
VQAVALEAQSTVAKVFGFQFPSTGSRLMLKVLCFSKELNNFEIIVAANEDQLPILIESTFAIVNTILRQFVTDRKRGGAIFTGQTDRSVTLSVRGTFIATVIAVFNRLLAIRLERILSSQLQTSKTRSLVDNHVVITFRSSKAPNVTVAAVEGFNIAQHVICTGR